MTQKTKTTSLIDYMKAGAEIKLIEALLWERNHSFELKELVRKNDD